MVFSAGCWKNNGPQVREKPVSYHKITLGPGVISFELLGMHESEYGSEAQTSF